MTRCSWCMGFPSLRRRKAFRPRPSSRPPVIAGSRFGYLGSSMPPNATPAVQADALAALIEARGISQIDVIGVSAGATSALQLALRHPQKVKHLAVLVATCREAQPPSSNRLGQASQQATDDLGAELLRLVDDGPHGGDDPKKFTMTSEDARFVTEFMDGLFSMIAEGYNFDLFVSNADVNDYNLEAVSMPGLIVHTKDNQLALTKRVSARRLTSPARGLSASNRAVISCSVKRRSSATNSRISLARGRSPHGACGVLNRR